MIDTDASEFERMVQARLRGYPDLSESGIATTTLLELTEEEVVALYYFYKLDRRRPGTVYGFVRGLATAYREFDPDRRHEKPQTEVLEVINSATRFIDLFTKREVVPMLGLEEDTGGLFDMPREGWDIYPVTTFTWQIANQSLPKLDELRQRVLDPTHIGIQI